MRWRSLPTSRKFTQFSCYNPIKTSFLAVVIANEPFLFSVHALCTHAMLLLILIDAQYLHNVIFSLEKDLNGQNRFSLGSHCPMKETLPAKFPIYPLLGKTSPTLLLLFAKPCTDSFPTKIPHPRLAFPVQKKL